MALTNEEIDQIADKVAEKLDKHSQSALYCPIHNVPVTFDGYEGKWWCPQGHWATPPLKSASELPQPTRLDAEVLTWFERDRAHVEVQDKRTEETVIEWWDEGVEQAFEDGFFKSGRPFHESVLDYAEHLGALAPWR